MSFMNLSRVIFWDVDYAQIDFAKSKRFVISRVVQYGTAADWTKIKDYYGLEVIKDEMTKERNLDARSLSFLSCILELPKEKFRCYINKQLPQKHFKF
jgi:hypothetical protein